MKHASIPVNIRRGFLFELKVCNNGAKKKPRKNVALSSNREASNRVEKCHSENPNEWITIIKVNETPYQMVNGINLFSEKCVSGCQAGVFPHNFSPYSDNLGVQSLNAMFQFGNGNRIQVLADNHVGWFLWCFIKVHGGSPSFSKPIFALRRLSRQPIVERNGDSGT
jgi:hypothetical protein